MKKTLLVLFLVPVLGNFLAQQAHAQYVNVQNNARCTCECPLIETSSSTYVSQYRVVPMEPTRIVYQARQTTSINYRSRGYPVKQRYNTYGHRGYTYGSIYYGAQGMYPARRYATYTLNGQRMY